MKSSHQGELCWYPALGYGTLLDPAVPQIEYDNKYMDQYRASRDSLIGQRLVSGRVGLVDRRDRGRGVLDFGAGSCAFVRARPMTLGYDISPITVFDLKSRGLYSNPYKTRHRIVTCWDSLEHLKNPRGLLDRIDKRVYLTIPIFKTGEQARYSKHYKPGEHYWYFTEWGLERYMNDAGFNLDFKSREEEDLGRESVGTFVFSRPD